MLSKKARLILTVSGVTIFLLIIVIAVHVYMVMQPKHVDNAQLTMARIDFKQPIAAADSAIVTQWLYQQKGVEYVLCNPTTNIAVIGFYPSQVNATKLVSKLTASLLYQATRYVPTQEQLNSGCPIIVESVGNKLYNYIKSHL
ncbi:MAG: hypothetical protein ACOVNY_11155 [Chitinophagaceae bacterium]|jgi:competence CoiA-like predicted nuclease